MSELGDRIASAARTWEGTAFVHGGRDRTGVDCGGLLLAVWWGLGLTTFDYPPYSRDEAPRLLVSGLEHLCVRCQDELEPGDVLLINLRGLPMHSGFYLGNEEFIHASDRRGIKRVVTRRFKPEIQARSAVIYRWGT